MILKPSQDFDLYRFRIRLSGNGTGKGKQNLKGVKFPDSRDAS